MTGRQNLQTPDNWELGVAKNKSTFVNRNVTFSSQSQAGNLHEYTRESPKMYDLFRFR